MNSEERTARLEKVAQEAIDVALELQRSLREMGGLVKIGGHDTRNLLHWLQEKLNHLKNSGD